MICVRLDWIRHAAPEYKTDPATCFTSAASGLSDVGIKQARLVGEWYGQNCDTIDAVYSSPAKRAVETAEIILSSAKTVCRHFDAPPIAIAKALRDRSYGSWEGQLKEGIFSEPGLRERFFEDAAFRPPGGESIADIRERVEGWIKRQIADPADTRHCLIVSHCKAIEAACNYFMSDGRGALTRKEVGLAEIVTVCRVSGEWKMFDRLAA